MISDPPQVIALALTLVCLVAPFGWSRMVTSAPTFNPSTGGHRLVPLALRAHAPAGRPLPESQVPRLNHDSGTPYVESTLVLFNNTLVGGNFQARNGATPEAGVTDSTTSETYVSNFGSDFVDVFNDKTDNVSTTVQVGTGPIGVALDTLKGEVFVANYLSDNVSVVNVSTNRVVATIGVGRNPIAIAYDSEGGEMFVANAGGSPTGNVSVINDSSNRVTGSIQVGIGPSSLAYDSNRGEVFVANYDSDTVSIINGTSELVSSTVPVGLGPSAVVYDDRTGQLFVANFGAISDNVTVINDSTLRRGPSIPVGVNPTSEIFDPARGEVYVSNSYSDNISVINVTTDKVVANATTGSYPEIAGYDRARGEVLVADSVYTLQLLNDSSNRITQSAELGASPDGALYVPGTSEIFVSNQDSNVVDGVRDQSNRVDVTISGAGYSSAMAYDGRLGDVYVPSSGVVRVFNMLTGAVVGNISVGNDPDGIVFDSAKGEMFVANYLSDNISVINDSQNRVVATVSLEGASGGPTSLAYDSGRGEVYVAEYSADNVSVINDTTDRVIASTSVGSAPVSLAYIPENREIIVANHDSDNLTFINDTSNKVTADIPVGGGPADLAFDPGAGEVFVANAFSDNITEVNVTSKLVEESFPVGSMPLALVYDPVSNELYVCDYGDGTLSIVALGTYQVTFYVAGPAGWSILVNGLKLTPLTGESSVVTELSNGSYTFAVQVPTGYTALPAFGTLNVAGSPVNQSIILKSSVQTEYLVKFAVSTNTTVTWEVWVAGQTLLPLNNSSTVTINLPNGSYTYAVEVQSGFEATPGLGSLKVSGGPVNLTIIVRAKVIAAYSVSFTVQSATTVNWSILIAGQVIGPADYGSTAAINLPNGSYTFAVSVPPGFQANPAFGNVTVQGSGTLHPIHISVTLAPCPMCSGPGNPTWYSLSPLAELVIGLSVVSMLSTVAIAIQRGRRTNRRNASESSKRDDES